MGWVADERELGDTLREFANRVADMFEIYLERQEQADRDHGNNHPTAILRREYPDCPVQFRARTSTLADHTSPRTSYNQFADCFRYPAISLVSPRDLRGRLEAGSGGHNPQAGMTAWTQGLVSGAETRSNGTPTSGRPADGAMSDKKFRAYVEDLFDGNKPIREFPGNGSSRGPESRSAPGSSVIGVWGTTYKGMPISRAATLDRQRWHLGIGESSRLGSKGRRE